MHYLFQPVAGRLTTTAGAVRAMVPVVMVEDTVRLTITVRETLIVGVSVSRPQHRLLVIVVWLDVSHL